MWIRYPDGRELIVCTMDCRLCRIPYGAIVDRDLDGYYRFSTNPHCPNCGNIGMMSGVADLDGIITQVYDNLFVDDDQ